ncbi:MAG: hypothetical protein H7259_01485 [Cytophagales bacterium]|nr:hypothetical protein [Cytophaga sp.]
MEKDAANDISYYVLVHQTNKNDLAAIRKWNNLKVAFEEGYIWIKDFDYVQIHALEVKSIPYITVFYSRQGKLFQLNSQLPDRNVPSLLWTAIERALPVTLPSFNHNYFGVSENIELRLIPSQQEVESIAMITSIDLLHAYLKTAPAIRLQKITWVLLGDDRVFLLGVPFLPIQGKAFWNRGTFMIPAGWDFDLFMLTGTLNTILNPANDNWVVWDTDTTYLLINKTDMRPLSLSSFRLSTLYLS